LKKLRMIVSVIFVLSICLFIGFYIADAMKDDTRPVITIEDDIIDVSLKMEDSELLKGVTAYNEKDGDITSKIIIESVSKFTSEKISTVTYAVCDDDNHVATAKRKIRFKDYTEPYFVIENSMVFAVGEDVDIASSVSAFDCIDGDISDRVIITTTDYETNKVGVFKVSLKVTNSMGDTIYMDMPVYVEEKSVAAPEVKLKDYLVHIKAGEEYDLMGNVEGAVDENGEKLQNVIIDSNYNPDNLGEYQAHYYTTDSQGREGHSILTIVVEG